MKKTTNSVYRNIKQWRIGFIALCALFTCLPAMAQTTGTVAIGSGTATGYGMPMDTWNNYNYSQQIVKSSDFITAGGAAGQITGIRFYIHNGLVPIANWTNWTVYIGHTTKSTFASTTDWEPLANLTQVFSGTITPINGQWLELTFTAPFTYNGSSNLIVALDENAAGKTDTSSATAFGQYPGATATGLRAGSSTNIDPATPPTGSLTATLARLQFVATLASCLAPTGIQVSNVGTTTATLEWTAPQVAADGYQYYTSATNTAPTAGTAGIDATGLTTQISGLNPSTTNYVWMRSKCGTSYSGWIAGPSFATLCTAANVPYTENFESVTTPALPICTSAVNLGTGNTWVTASPATTLFNTKVLRYGYTSAVANTWFFTRGVNLTAGTSYRIAYKYGTVGYTEKLEVGYGTAADAGSMTQLIDYPAITGTAATDGFVDFIPASTGVYYFGFHAYSAASQNYIYIDDIAVTVTPTCFRPTALTVTSTGMNNAVISWQHDGVSANYHYYYSTTNTTPADNATPNGSVLGSETTADVQGLTSNTVYYIWVRNDCGNNDLSAWTPAATFRTQCDAANVPYTEDFESVTTPALPLCTTAVNEGTGNTWGTAAPALYGITTKALRYSPSYTAAANAWFYTRAINLTAGITYRLSYKYSNSSATLIEKLEVAYGTATQSGTMLLLADHPSITGAAATDTYVDFTPSATGVYYIGFKAYSAMSQSTLYVDNINVIVAPTCNVPTAVVANAASITANSAAISWTPDGISAGYQYYHSTTNTTPAATVTPDGSTDANTLTATFNGLTSNTVYYAWVRNNCGGGDLSAWSLSTTFRTLCDAANVPYTEDFESVTTPALPACTSAMRVGTTGNTWGTSSPAAYGFTTKALRYSVSYTYPANTWFFTRGVNLTAGTSYRIAYKYGNSSSFTTEKLEVAYGNSTTAEAMLQLADHPVITGAAASTTYVDFVPTTTGVYYFGFKAYSAVSQGTLYVDDISVNLSPSCINPTGLTATATSTTSISLAWNAAAVAPANGYQYYYSTTNTAPTATETNTHDVPTGITATVNGLTSATPYFFWVRSNCGNNDFSEWTAVARATTQCDAANVPYTENFESVTTPALPACTIAVNAGNGNTWATGSPGTTAFNSKVLRYGYSSTAAADTWFFTRGVNLVAGTSYRLSYRYGNASFTEKLKVSYGTSATVAAMATTPLADHPSITGTSNVSTFVDFIPATSGVYYFGFHAYSASYQNVIYIDDISVDVSPTCFAPTGVVTSNPGLTTAHVAWTAPSQAPSAGYQYYHSTTNTTPANTVTPSGSVGAGVLEADVTGLTSATTNYIWVRGNCGNNDFSAWTAVASVTTLCEAANVPYTENFESVTTPALPACTSVINAGTGNLWATASPGSAAFGTKVLRYGYTTAAAANTWFFTRGINLVAGTSYRLSYRYGNASFTEKLKVSYGTSATVEAMATTPLADHPSITGTSNVSTFVDFTPATSGVYYFGFHAYSAASQNVIYLDDISVDVSPSCFAPTGVVTSNPGLTTAHVAWTAPLQAPSAGYQYYHGTTNTTPASTVTPSGSVGAGVLEADLTGLTSATTNYIWVRGNCGNNDFSAWSAVASVTTMCDAANVPYTENFESATTPALPACITAVNNGAGNIWTTASPNAFGFTSKAIRVAYTSAGAPNTWFFTRGINLTAGTTYKLTYKYGGSAFVEKLKVSYGTSATVAAMATTPLADHPNITGSTPSNGSVEFTPDATGVYYFGFHAYSAAAQNSLYVDDISVDVALGTGSFDVASFRHYPNPVKDVLNLTYSADITSVAVYNLLGQQVLAKDVNATEASVDMSQLADGTYIVNVTAGDSVKAIKVIKKQ